MARGIAVGLVILGTGLVLADLPWAHPGWVAAFLVLVSALLACLGLIMGLWAQTWDNIMLMVNFFITPLVFLGGVFYSIDMLPPFWRSVTLFNPVVYLVSGFRWSFYGVADVEVGISIAAICGFLVACLAAIWWILRTGWKLKA